MAAAGGSSDELSGDGQCPKPAESDDERDHRGAFARVFAANDRWLYAYLVTLLGSPADAEEVFQEVCVVLWRDYKKFDPATSFVKWASVVAHNQVHRFRRSQSRQSRVLSDATVELLAADAVEQADLHEARRSALHRCLTKLKASDRELIRACYSDTRRTMKTVAQSLGKPVNTVYKAISRIRGVLHDCIERQLAQEGVQ